MIGDNFVVAGSGANAGTTTSNTPTRIFTFDGENWVKTAEPSTGSPYIGNFHHTGTLNYYITHNRDNNGSIFDPIVFSYLNEEKIWQKKILADNATLRFNATAATTNWHSDNSRAVVMAADNPEFVYRWDNTYTNFFKDTHDKDNNPLIGNPADHAPVFMLNNGMIGIDGGRIIRWDGVRWHGANITSTHTSPYGFYFSYGDDFVVRPAAPAVGGYKGARLEFDPNAPAWKADAILDGSDVGTDFANAGIDYHFFGKGYYYRQPNGSWVRKFSYAANPTFSRGGYPRFEAWYSPYPYRLLEVRYLKNGEMQSPLTIANVYLHYNSRKFINPGAGNQTVITYAGTSAHEAATVIRLYRLVNDALADTQTDMPVNLITEFDGSQSRYTSLDYNFFTATIDEGGSIAQYNEVTVIPGSNSVAYKPYGYTKTYFYNGLSAAELGVSQADLRWSGLSYQTLSFDNNGNQVAYQKTGYTPYTVQLNNSLSARVDVGYYSRPTQTRSLTDGIETIINQEYDASTGLLAKTTSIDYDFKPGNTGQTTSLVTEYTYYWQRYDPSRSTNILSPVIQTVQRANNEFQSSYLNVTAITWKNWNGVAAPHKTYLKKFRNTGAVNFNFGSWSGINEPPADWIKLSEINQLDSRGNVLQVTNR